MLFPGVEVTRLLSSLYKNGYVNPVESGFRIINSNSMVEEKVRLYVDGNTVNHLEKAEDDFDSEDSQDQNGEFATLNEISETVNPQEMVEHAENEAKELLANAKNEAEALLDDAKTQAESLRTVAAEEGKKAGYEAGLQVALQELETKKAEIEELKQKLTQNYQEKVSKMEPELTDVILNVFESVFGIQLLDKREVLIHLVQDAIEKIEGVTKFQIRVAPSRVEALENSKEQIQGRVGASISIEIIADSNFKETDCQIETENGIYECGTLIQMDNLVKQIRSVSENEETAEE